MFGWLKPDPRKQLQREYDKLMLEARDAQRTQGVLASGLIQQRAEEVLAKIRALDAGRDKG
jgi:hypothetical protein